MNKRDAKIIALRDAGTMIDAGLAAGYPYNDDFGDAKEKDLDKIAAEMQKIADTLIWRAEDLKQRKRTQRKGRR